MIHYHLHSLTLCTWDWPWKIIQAFWNCEGSVQHRVSPNWYVIFSSSSSNCFDSLHDASPGACNFKTLCCRRFMQYAATVSRYNWASLLLFYSELQGFLGYTPVIRQWAQAQDLFFLYCTTFSACCSSTNYCQNVAMYQGLKLVKKKLNLKMMFEEGLVAILGLWSFSHKS